MSCMNTQTITIAQGFLSLREFVANYAITEIIPEIRENSNGYSFITFVNDRNDAENVYFGSSIAKDYSAGTPVTRAMLDRLQIYQYAREDGKQGLRLVRKAGNESKVSIDTLL